MIALAIASDVEAGLGRSLTTEEAVRVEPILAKASALFRRRSGQDFTTGTSTVRLKVNGGKVYLPQHPVTAVTTVTTVINNDVAFAVEYTRLGQWLTVWSGLTVFPTYPVYARETLASDVFVDVTYDHGGDVPDLVVLCIADIARQVLLIAPNATTGVTQHSETKGPFTTSDTYATWAIGGQTRLSPEDNALADDIRRANRAPRVIVMQP